MGNQEKLKSPELGPKLNPDIQEAFESALAEQKDMLTGNSRIFSEGVEKFKQLDKEKPDGGWSPEVLKKMAHLKDFFSSEESGSLLTEASEADAAAGGEALLSGVEVEELLPLLAL